MREGNITVFIISGSLPNLLFYSKVLPIINSDKVKKVVFFRREKWKELPKGEYIICPHIIEYIKPFRIIFEFFQIFYYSYKYKPDILNGIYTIPHGLVGLIIGRILGIPNITSIIGDEGELRREGYRFPHIFKLINKFVFHYSNILTTKGDKTINFLSALGVNKSKVFVFNGAIDTEKFCEIETSRDIDILFVGKFIPRKGPDRFISIAEEVKKRIPEIKCYMIGDGPLLNSAKLLVKEKGLETNIYFTGYIEHVQHYYQRAKILLLPSRGEGLSTAMVEAMSCGCVPIVSDVGNMTEAAHHDYNSMVVNDYMDIQTYTCHTLQLMEDPEKFKTLSKNAISTVYNNYSIQEQAKIFNNILNYCSNTL